MFQGSDIVIYFYCQHYPMHYCHVMGSFTDTKSTLYHGQKTQFWTPSQDFGLEKQFFRGKKFSLYGGLKCHFPGFFYFQKKSGFP
jgi:hypothetical protein